MKYTVFGKFIKNNKKEHFKVYKESFTIENFKDKNIINDTIENFDELVYQRSNIKPITEKEFVNSLNNKYKK